MYSPSQKLKRHNATTVEGHNPTFFFFLRATPTAYGGSQARGQIGVVAAGLRHSHSNAGSELLL